MLTHLPIVILASLPFTQISDSVPKFDIARECRSEGGPKAVLDRCVADESRRTRSTSTAMDSICPPRQSRLHG